MHRGSRYYSPRSNDSSVVQSVERRTVNPYVTGSSPVRGAKLKKEDVHGRLLFAFKPVTYPQLYVQQRPLTPPYINPYLMLYLLAQPVRFVLCNQMEALYRALTDVKIRNEKISDKPVKLTDGFGMYLR